MGGSVPSSIDALLCEHVWEHLTEAEGRAAARLCFEYLKPGGYLRLAVPDRNFRNAEYQRGAQIGGPIYRSLLSDHRNRQGRLGFVSLIADAKKSPNR